MRRELRWLLAVNGTIILFLLYQVSDLLSLLYDNSASDTLTVADLESEGPSLIPKIIHQTYKTEAIPEIWNHTHATVVDMHPDYQYILWTDESARNFVKEHYSWFLPTYDAYPYPIMRADVIRYFVLYHYGGIYIDLDNGVTQKLDPLTKQHAWLRKTKPTGVSNDLMGSRPKHPFFKKVIDNLEKYNRNWFVSYITIMFSTGPLFVSVIWKQYKRWGMPKEDVVSILVNKDPTKFFFTAQGSSWHLGDAKFIMQMGKHWVFFFFLGTALVLSILYLQYRFYQWLGRRLSKSRYERLNQEVV
ncbi:mannosyl phosphorylinositol ceramide synthase Csh1p [Trichomonascus vanleenenianus]|uniref:glycosyltransferase family 32 protein n=1 Tax=Trichomonascus vanleenenianus TaxID=2268995 RepID=UPI003ECABC5F